MPTSLMWQYAMPARATTQTPCASSVVRGNERMSIPFRGVWVGGYVRDATFESAAAHRAFARYPRRHPPDFDRQGSRLPTRSVERLAVDLRDGGPRGERRGESV